MNKPTYEELDKRVQEPGQIIARHSIKEAESNIPVDPGTQTMNYASNGQILDLASIIDVKAIQDLMNDFYSLTNIGVAILDLNGNVLVATGWQDICTKFHRVHPVTAKNCLESDIELSKGIEPGTFRIYRCKNKMVDMATPIMLGNQKVGNLHLGQFFFEDEPPDIEAFRTRSQRHGFDENGYIHALKKAPRWSREKVTTVMNFYTKLAHIISELGYKNFMLCQNVMDKNDLLNSLRDSEEKYRTLLKTTSEGCWILNPELQTIEINESLCKMLGYRQDEMLGKIPFDFVDDENRKIFIEQTSKISTTEHRGYEITLKTKKGDALHTFFNATTIKDKSGEVQGSFALITDVTEKKRMAELLRHSEKNIDL